MKSSMNYKLILPYLFCLSVIFAGCGKKNNSGEEPIISIELLSPTAYAQLKVGDTLRLNAIVSSPVDLHGYTYTLTTREKTKSFWAVAEHTHARNFTLNDTWVVTPEAASAALTFTLKIEVDHEGKESKTSIQLN